MVSPRASGRAFATGHPETYSITKWPTLTTHPLPPIRPNTTTLCRLRSDTARTVMGAFEQTIFTSRQETQRFVSDLPRLKLDNSIVSIPFLSSRFVIDPNSSCGVLCGSNHDEFGTDNNTGSYRIETGCLKWPATVCLARPPETGPDESYK